MKNLFFISMLLPLLIVGQENKHSFNSSLDFSIQSSYINPTYFPTSIYPTHFNSNKLSFSLNNYSLTKDKSIFILNAINYKSSIYYNANNNVFYKGLHQEKVIMENVALNLFLGLIIEVCRVVETPSASFCH